MIINVEIIAKLVSPVFTLIIGVIIKRFTERRANIISSIGYVSSFIGEISRPQPPRGSLIGFPLTLGIAVLLKL